MPILGRTGKPKESQRSGYPCLAFSSRAELEDPFGKNEFFSTKFENFRTKIIKSWTGRQSSPREATGKFEGYKISQK